MGELGCGWHRGGFGVGDGCVAMEEGAGHGSNLSDGVDGEGVQEDVLVVKGGDDVVPWDRDFDGLAVAVFDGVAVVVKFVVGSSPVPILPALRVLMMRDDKGRLEN